MENKKKSVFTKEYRAQVIALVRQPERSVSSVAKELGLSIPTVHSWVRQNKIDTGNGEAGQLTSAEKKELSQLRKEVKDLRMEREFLKKTATWFARENK